LPSGSLKSANDQTEAGLLDVENLPAVHVRDGDEHEFELQIHDASSFEFVGRVQVT